MGVEKTSEEHSLCFVHLLSDLRGVVEVVQGGSDGKLLLLLLFLRCFLLFPLQFNISLSLDALLHFEPFAFGEGGKTSLEVEGENFEDTLLPGAQQLLGVGCRFAVALHVDVKRYLLCVSSREEVSDEFSELPLQALEGFG